MLGGPFDSKIEGIIRSQALFMQSPVVSGCDAGVHGIIRGFRLMDERPSQSCDILIKLERDIQLVSHAIFMKLSFIIVINRSVILLQSGEFFNVNLRMLGYHQLQNAITAACAVLCLRDQGTVGLMTSSLSHTPLQ